MHRIRTFALSLLLLSCSGSFALSAVDDPQGLDDSEKVLRNERGTILHVSGDWYGIVPDSDPRTRYAPDHLDETFRQDDLRVIFSGTVLEIEAGSRRWGTPLKLTSILLLDDE